MLKSLFGELGTVGSVTASDFQRPGDFAATAVLESHSSEHTERGEWVDQHVQDLFVTGSPAQAIRSHLQETWADPDGTTTRHITLYDPVRMWAGAVVKALSDASAQPIERLNLRDQSTLATLATIERTVLPRRVDETLKVYHAELRTAVADAASVPMALMENSHLTAVIIGPMHSTLVDAMLAMLLGATRNVHWRCPNLLFLLPVDADWIAPKIHSVPWPPGIEVDTLNEPLTSAATVWNLLMGHWTHLHPPGELAAFANDAGHDAQPVDITSAPSPFDASNPLASPFTPLPPLPVANVRDLSGQAPDDLVIALVMQSLRSTDGILAAALVNGAHGSLLAHDESGPVDLELAAASAADLLRAHNRCARYFAPTTAHVNALVVNAGPRQMLVRVVEAHPQLFLLLIVDHAKMTLDAALQHLSQAQQQLV